MKAMSDVLVCAEPAIREEATEFVSKLGARPQVFSTRAFKKWREKADWLLVYLKSAQPSSTLRSCLRQVSSDSSLHVIVYTHTHPSDDHQSAELGRIIGEFRPRKTYICFYAGEVEEIFHERIGVAGKAKATSSETPVLLREDLNLTQVDLAAALDVTPRTVQNWEKHGRGPERRYRDLKELRGLLLKYIGSDQIATWMDSPNDAFRKRTPRELMREGKTRDLILGFARFQTGEPL
jgi:transcriptional regulator with XRE-family HTH domain